MSRHRLETELKELRDSLRGDARSHPPAGLFSLVNEMIDTDALSDKVAARAASLKDEAAAMLRKRPGVSLGLALLLGLAAGALLGKRGRR
jgi:ElaB/YqjD/DUF883 family membrane-anchored ribosome-binding protein